jgi:hypothetical protein
MAVIKSGLVHHLLPLKLKFLPETFVAVEPKKGKVVGLVTLEKNPQNPHKLKITKFFLEENSLSEGEQLIKFVISKYCSIGADGFQIVFPETLENMSELFVNRCKFRICAREFLYKTDSASFLADNDTSANFKPFKNAHAKAVCELHNSILNSHQKHSLIKHPKQFKGGFFAHLGKTASLKYILKDKTHGAIAAFFAISAQDSRNWLLEPIISPASDECFGDIINFAAKELSRRSKDWALHIKIKTGYFNFENLKARLEAHKFPLGETRLVLVRDFMQPVKKDAHHCARIIFNTAATEL